MSAEFDVLVCPMFLFPGPISLSGHSPGRLTDAALSFAPASTMGMIHGVHGHTPHHRPPPQPPGSSSLAQLSVFVLWV